ncbi:MAG: PepSY domain-containing protein [Fimbriimonadaceae bacterium]|nr:PepSY domain-containing protein [Fimbriimonadaceae bacterium]
MYRLSRTLHKWSGVVLSLFLILLGVTGLLLAIKSRVGWLRVETQDGAEIAGLVQVIPIEQVAEAAFSAGLASIQKREDIYQIDYRRKQNTFKVLSADRYDEVQVCGATGKVLSVARRNDQWIEDIHDLSFFNENLRTTLLPVVGFGLTALGVTGIVIFFTPVVRRARFERDRKAKKSSGD